MFGAVWRCPSAAATSGPSNRAAPDSDTDSSTAHGDADAPVPHADSDVTESRSGSDTDADRHGDFCRATGHRNPYGRAKRHVDRVFREPPGHCHAYNLA